MDEFKRILSLALKKQVSELVLQEGKRVCLVLGQESEELPQSSEVVQRGWILDILSELYDESAYEQAQKGQAVKSLFQIRGAGDVQIASRKGPQGFEVRFFFGADALSCLEDHWQTWHEDAAVADVASSLPPLPSGVADSVSSAHDLTIHSSGLPEKSSDVLQKNMSSWVASGVSSFAEMEDSTTAYPVSSEPESHGADPQSSSSVEEESEDEGMAFSSLPSELPRSLAGSSDSAHQQQETEESMSSSFFRESDEDSGIYTPASAPADETMDDLRDLNLSALEGVTETDSLESDDASTRQPEPSSLAQGLAENSLQTFLEENVNFKEESAADERSAQEQKSTADAQAPLHSSPSSSDSALPPTPPPVPSEISSVEQAALSPNNNNTPEEAQQSGVEGSVGGEYFVESSEQQEQSSALAEEDNSSSFVVVQNSAVTAENVLQSYLKKLSAEGASWGFVVSGCKLWWRSEGALQEAKDLAVWNSGDAFSDLKQVLSYSDEDALLQGRISSAVVRSKEGDSFMLQWSFCTQGLALSFKNLNASYGDLSQWNFSAAEQQGLEDLKADLRQQGSRGAGLYVLSSLGAACRGALSAYLVDDLLLQGPQVVKSLEGPEETLLVDPRWGPHVKVGGSYEQWCAALSDLLSSHTMPCDVLQVSGIPQQILGDVLTQWLLPAVADGVKVFWTPVSPSAFSCSEWVLRSLLTQDGKYAGHREVLAEAWKWLVCGVWVGTKMRLEYGRMTAGVAAWIARSSSKDVQKKLFYELWSSSGGSTISSFSEEEAQGTVSTLHTSSQQPPSSDEEGQDSSYSAAGQSWAS